MQLARKDLEEHIAGSMARHMLLTKTVLDRQCILLKQQAAEISDLKQQLADSASGKAFL